MKRYYTRLLPTELRDRLREVGFYPKMESPTYGDALDWFYCNGLWINITQHYNYAMNGCFCFVIPSGSLPRWFINELLRDKGIYRTWHGAANAAIEKGIKLFDITR